MKPCYGQAIERFRVSQNIVSASLSLGQSRGLFLLFAGKTLLCKPEPVASFTREGALEEQ